jgi:DUF218 domain
LANGKRVLIILAEEASTAEGTGTLFRLQKAVRYLEIHQIDVVVLSGGKYSPGQEQSTARMMNDWLVLYFEGRCEQPLFHVIEEGESINTYENILFSVSLLNRNLDKVYIVSERGHLRRVMYILKKVHQVACTYTCAIAVDYKGWLGRFWERLLYIYTLVDPTSSGWLIRQYMYYFRAQNKK